jgi:hypothetical protein
MSRQDAREELITFLDRKVFDPILHRSRESFRSDADKRKFDDVKRSTESEKRRFHDDYHSASDVRANYLSDLTSEVGKRKTHELEQLELPTLPQVKSEFLDLCRKLGVDS